MGGGRGVLIDFGEEVLGIPESIGSSSCGLGPVSRSHLHLPSVVKGLSSPNDCLILFSLYQWM